MVVMEEMMMPRPSPRPAMMRMMAGIRMRVKAVEGVEGVEVIKGVEDNLYQSMAERRSKNWMPNFTILLITVDNGITSLGK